MRPNIPDSSATAAFNRLELSVIICVVVLLAVVTYPVIAGSRTGSNRATCINNVSRIGQGYAMWSTEHGELYPWQLYSSAGSDGSAGLTMLDHFRAISNEVVTPRILACPSDPNRIAASTFSVTEAQALLSSATSISYFLAHPSLQQGRTVLSGDRNFQTSTPGPACTQFRSISIIPSAETNAAWNNQIHVRSGQLLFNDGSVDSTQDDGLRAAFGKPGFDGAATHFVLP